MEGLKSMHWAVASNHFEAWLCPRNGAFSADSHFGISDFAHFWANVYQCGRFVAGKSGKWPCPSDNRGGPDRNGWSTKIGSASPSLWGVESQQLPDTLLLQRIPMGETKLVIVHQCPPQGLYRAAGTWQIVAVLILSLKYSRHNYILLAIILSRILHFWRESWSSTATTNWIMNWAKDHSVARLSRCWDDGMDMRYANALARRYLRFSTEPKENQRMSANSLWDFRSYFGVLNILKTRLWFAKHCDCVSLSQKVSSQRIFQVLPVAACCTDCAGTLPDRSRWSHGQNESIHRGSPGRQGLRWKFSCFGFQENIIDMMWMMWHICQKMHLYRIQHGVSWQKLSFPLKTWGYLIFGHTPWPSWWLSYEPLVWKSHEESTWKPRITGVCNWWCRNGHLGNTFSLLP